MLCNTFSVALAQQMNLNQQSQVENQLAATNSTLNQPFQTLDQQQRQQQQQQQQADRDGCFSALGTLIDGRDRANSYNFLETDNYERGCRSNNTFQDGKSFYNSSHSSQDSYKQLNWQSNSANRASVVSATENNGGNNNNNKSSTMMTINNMSSLSCLITPIRRSNAANQQSNDKQQPHESRNLSSGVDIVLPFGSGE